MSIFNPVKQNHDMQLSFHFLQGGSFNDPLPEHPLYPNFISWTEIGNLVKHLGRLPLDGDMATICVPSLYSVSLCSIERCYAIQVVVIGNVGNGWYIVEPTPREIFFNQDYKGKAWAVHHSNLDMPYLPLNHMGPTDVLPLEFHKTITD